MIDINPGKKTKLSLAIKSHTAAVGLLLERVNLIEKISEGMFVKKLELVLEHIGSFVE